MLFVQIKFEVILNRKKKKLKLFKYLPDDKKLKVL